MLVMEDLLSKMKKHFPRWMDIRRKSQTSSGGLLLESMAEEVADIQAAIEDYKKDFFIDNYIGKEDDIITFIYKANIGSTDPNKVVIINPDLDIVLTQEEFYSDKEVCYYEDGVIYFKTNYKEVQYSIEGYKSITSLEKIHVWNIFDEFACFVGLKRYQWETNKELLNRILTKSNKTINSSEEGLKNALITNLINIAPELKTSDIIIERPTAENLNNYYNEFETILDHLANINRDVYRTKKWDIDTWNFNVKSVDYIPHAWDVVLKSYADGVGFKDDLKVEIVDNNAKTDVYINFYKKQEEVINSYVKNNNIKEKIKLNLKRYDNDLKSQKVKYRISASEATKLDVANTRLKFYENKVGLSKVKLEDIAETEPDYLFGIDIEDKSILDPAYKYKIKFIPTKEIGDFKIRYCKQVNEDVSTNLITEQSGFRFIDDKKEGVVPGKTKAYIIDSYQFSEIQNTIKTIDGFIIEDISSEATLKLNLNGYTNETLFYDYSTIEVPMVYSNIIRQNCFIKNDYIVPDTVEEEKSISIKMPINSLSMTIEGPYTITYSLNQNGKQVINNFDNEKIVFNIPRSHTPQDLDLKIVLHDSKCKISDIKYSHYEFKMTTEKEEYYHSPNGATLPAYNYNNLIITMRTYTGFSPVLKYIYIGEKLNEYDSYTGIEFDPLNGTKLLTNFNDCRLELTKLNRESGDIIEVIDNYIPYKHYSSLSNNAQMELFLDEFSEIESIKAEGCTIETLNYGGGFIQYLLKIPAGIKVYNVEIKGKIKKLIKNTTLSNVLKEKGYSPVENEFYVAKNTDDIIVKSIVNNSLRYIKLTRRDLFSIYNITSIEIVPALDNNIQTKFIERNETNTDNKIITITNNFNSYFDFLTFTPVDSDVYIAINEHSVVLPETKNIPIVNTFTKGYDSTKLMFYTVESLTESHNVLFSNNQDKTLDEDSFKIVRNNNLDADYNYEIIVIEKEFPLGSSIELPRVFINENKEQIELDNYIITNDLNIVYSNKNTDPNNIDDYYYTETLYVDETGFNKLKYSNIEDVSSIHIISGGESVALKAALDYELLKQEGIIIWKDKNLIDNNSVVNIRYHINKAKHILIDLDELYKKIKYNVNSFALINTVKLEKISKDQTIDLNIYESYKTADLTSINCVEPGFTSKVKDGILRFEKNLENNTVAVKSGYYYMDGNEYYLYADDNFDNIEKIDDIYFNNVVKENKQFILKQQTTNYITNSSMKLNALGTIFNLNCKDKNFTGISRLNAITACDSFNYWKSIASNLSIVKGVNGQGIKFTSMKSVNGYSYLPISKFLEEDIPYTLSFYLIGNDCKAYLGQERIIHSANTEFNKESVIDIVREIQPSPIEQGIFETNFENKSGENFVLIVSGTGLIDDIIAVEQDKYEVGIHKKNIDHLKLSIEENIYAEYSTRLFLTEEDGSIFDGTEIKDSNIINSSYIHWGFTKLDSINTYEEFKKCVLNNIDLDQFNNKCVARTTGESGYLITNPIYVGNVRTIKNFLFKINNVMFDNMKGFKVKILTADNVGSSFKDVSQHLDNIGAISGDKLLSYVKLMVEMPQNKVINNIELFIEYLSNEVDTPSEMSVLSGTYTSKVLDAGYNERFLVKKLNVSNLNQSLSNYIFQVRASKENDERTTWTDWKEITLKSDYEDTNYNLKNRIVFDGYRFFQFRIILKGEDTSVKLNYMDLEVI